MHRNIPGARPDGQGGFIVLCNTTTVVTLIYAGHLAFDIDLAWLPVNSNDSVDCVSGITGGYNPKAAVTCECSLFFTSVFSGLDISFVFEI